METTKLVLVPMVPALLCPALSVVIYIIARRRADAESQHKSRAFIFYRMVSGTLFGEVIARLYFFSSVWLSSFVAIGFIGYDTCEIIARIWNTNPNYVAPDDSVHKPIGLNPVRMEMDTIIASDDVGSDDFSREVFRVQDTFKDETKRVWVLGSMYIIFLIMALADGIKLAVNHPDTVSGVVLMILFYGMTCVALTTTIYSGMIHAHLHLVGEKRARIFWWTTASATWCFILFCATVIPTLVGVSQSTAQSILSHFGLLAFFGIAVGALLKLQFYFHNMKIEQIDRTDLVWGAIAFILSTAQAIAAGFFL